MTIDIGLAIIFLGSIVALWYRISIKLPELIAVPDQIIAERLEEDSARFRLFLLNFKSWFREGRYKTFLLNILGKLLYRLHILFLKVDNALVALLRKMRENGAAVNGNGFSAAGGANGKADYWKKLHSEEEVLPQSRRNRISEVRERK